MKLSSIFKGALSFTCTILLGVSIHAQDSGADEITDIGTAKSFDTPSGYPTPPGSGGALHFDGANDIVLAGTEDLNPGQGSFSISAWVIDISSPNQWHHIIQKYGFGGLNGGPGGPESDVYALSLFSNGQVRFTIRDQFANEQRCESQISIHDSNWHHITATLNRVEATVNLYIDGILEDSDSLFIPGEISPQNNLTLGGAEDFLEVGFTSFFNGYLDEIRIWNGVALTQQEIREYMCQKDLSSHPQIDHLAAYYRFDEDQGNSQLADLSGNGNTGNLVNMDNDSSWVNSGAPIGDISVYAQNEPGFSLDIGNSFAVEDLSEDIEGVHIYRVDEAPNNASVPSDFSSLVTSEYYGVFAVSDSIPAFTVAYDYENDANVNNQPNELSVRFASRSDNSAGAFQNTTNQSVNSSAKRLSAGNKTNGEYILGFGDFDCPILGDDIGEGCDDNDPTTGNDEINANCDCVGQFVCANPFPPVTASSLATTFQGNGYQLSWGAVPNQIGCQIAVRFAGGTTLGQQIVGGASAQSFFVPGSVLQLGTDYEWRVRCGCSQFPIVAGPWSAWQPFTTPVGASIAASPNPTEGFSQVTFSVQVPQYVTLEVMDMNGRMIERLFAGNANPDAEYRFEFDGSGLPNGVYLYRLTTAQEVVVEKLLIAK